VTSDGKRTHRVRRISIVVPMYNEAAHIENLVSDIAAQDFDGEIEVFVADGASVDASVELVRRTAGRMGVDVAVLENPTRWVSTGLNACIRHATGDLIVRLDCHARYPADYLRRCAVAAEETGAWVVGGNPVPEGRTPMERAVACTMTSPFGGVFWNRHGNRHERVEVDNFFCGAFRPEAFDRVGLFDESLVRNQDEELNFRIRAAGGTLVLDRNIRARYVPRNSFRRLFQQYYEYGFWKIPLMRKHRSVLSARSLVPILFVGSLGAAAAAAVFSERARLLLVAEGVVYGCCAAGFGAVTVAKRRESWRILPRVVATFPTLHIAYGLGMLNGLMRSVGGGSVSA
jgi:succinoglycan biosynthesis protein ExoA